MASKRAAAAPPAGPGEVTPKSATRAWVVVFIAGVIAAMHVWKFPGAMQFIRTDISMSLVEAGTLLGIVQVAAMILGLALSLFSVRVGMRTTLLIGLCLLAAGSFAGALSTETWHLMVTRAVEGVGFILVTVVGPPLIRHWAPPDRISSAMGWWSAFQGTAVFIAMVTASLLLGSTDVISWHGWWVFMGVISVVGIMLALRYVPKDRSDVVDLGSALGKISATVKTLMPWMMALMFSLYTLQWGAIIGFLPDVAAASGLGVLAAGLATAVVGGLNGVGNVIAGKVLQRGGKPRTMVMFGMGSMLVLTTLTFAPDWSAIPHGYWYQLAMAGLFSGIAAVIPAVITRVAVDVAPPEGAPSAVIGLMSQVYSGANFVGPIILTAIAAAAGTWRLSWVLTASASIIGFVLAAVFLTSSRLRCAGQKQ